MLAGASALGLAGSAFHGQAELTLAQPASPAATSGSAATSGLGAISLQDLMNVQVTTVSREESTVGESPAAVFVVTQEMIHRSGATCIPEILRMVPGVNVARLGSNQWVISIRGFDSTLANKLLVQVDGRTVYSPVQSGVFWDTVDYPLEDIERIEVVRGPGGTVWGANAVNGVINIITKSSKETHGGLLSGGGGSVERGFATARFGGQIGDSLHYRAYGKWFERGSYFSLADLAHDDWRSARAGLRFDWTPTTKDTVTVQGDWFSVVAGSLTTDTETRGVNALARWTHEIAKQSNWELQAYYDRFDERSRDGSLRFTVNTYDVDFHQQFPLSDWNKFNWGLGYRLQKIFVTGSIEVDDDAPFGGARVDVYRAVYSAFLQDEIRVIDKRLYLTLGSKFEENDFTGFEFQPSGRLLWTPTKRQSVWASVSRAVRTPDILENALQFGFGSPAAGTPGPAVFPRLVFNRDLDAEEVIAYELGYRAQATDRLAFDAAVFYNQYEKLSVLTNGAITPGPLPASLVAPIQWTNGMSGETYGFELAATWSPTDWWKVYAAYSYVRVNLHLSRDVTSDLNVSFVGQERQTPQNHFYLRSSFDIPGNVQFDLIGRYVDSLPGFTPGVKPYLTLDARLAWKPRDYLEFAIVGQNLLDADHPENGNGIPIEVPRGLYGSVTVQW